MRVSIEDGRIVGFNTITEQAAKWNTTNAAIKRMVDREQINKHDYICLRGNKPSQNVYFFRADLEKPTRNYKKSTRNYENCERRQDGWREI